MIPIGVKLDLTKFKTAKLVTSDVQENANYQL